jgi:hypothetical protein
MQIIAVPGLWLDASSWDDVVPASRRPDTTRTPTPFPASSRSPPIAPASVSTRGVARVVYVDSGPGTKGFTVNDEVAHDANELAQAINDAVG